MRLSQNLTLDLQFLISHKNMHPHLGAPLYHVVKIKTYFSKNCPPFSHSLLQTSSTRKNFLGYFSLRKGCLGLAFSLRIFLLRTKQVGLLLGLRSLFREPPSTHFSFNWQHKMAFSWECSLNRHHSLRWKFFGFNSFLLREMLLMASLLPRDFSPYGKISWPIP